MPNYTTPREPRKTCSKCKRSLTLDHFTADKRKAYGVTCHCRDCKRAYRQANRRMLRRSAYRRRANDSDYARKRVAWNAVYYALQHGQLHKPDTCEVCGVHGERIQAHHDDYDKPFEIIWCCQSCHSQLDKARREEESRDASA